MAAIPPGQAARGASVEFVYRNPDGGQVQFVPQHIVVLGQGNDATSYDLTRRRLFSAAEAAERYGYGSPLHAALLAIMPEDGNEGPGGIKVEVLPLAKHASGTKAAGAIVPSAGPLTKPLPCRVRVGSQLSQAFVGKKGWTDADWSLAAADAINATPKMQVTASVTEGVEGSCAAPVVTRTTTSTGTVTVPDQHPNNDYSLVVEILTTGTLNTATFQWSSDGGTTWSDEVTVPSGGTYALSGTGVTLTFTPGAGPKYFEAGDEFAIACTAPTGTKVVTTAKWSGASANGMPLAVVAADDAGMTFTFEAMADGAANPSDTAVGEALAKLGEDWVTILVNTLGEDTDVLDTIASWGEGRWDPLLSQPVVSFFAGDETDPEDVIAVTDARPTDRTNVKISVPDALAWHGTAAARAALRVALVAHSNPPMEYSGQPLDGVVPGAPDKQWLLLNGTKDAIVKGGCSTTRIQDNRVVLDDVVTCYHPSGESVPAYRPVSQIQRLGTISYNMWKLIRSWDGLIVLPDGQPTDATDTINLSQMKTQIRALIDTLGRKAIATNLKRSKASVVVEFDSEDPDKINLGVQWWTTGNANKMPATMYWSRYFGK